MSSRRAAASSTSILMLAIAFSACASTSPMPTVSRVSRSWPICPRIVDDAPGYDGLAQVVVEVLLGVGVTGVERTNAAVLHRRPSAFFECGMGASLKSRWLARKLHVRTAAFSISHDLPHGRRSRTPGKGSDGHRTGRGRCRRSRSGRPGHERASGQGRRAASGAGTAPHRRALANRALGIAGRQRPGLARSLSRDGIRWHRRDSPARMRLPIISKPMRR